MKKKYLSTIFFVTAISLTLSGCNDYKDRQFEQEIKAANAMLETIEKAMLVMNEDGSMEEF